MLQSVGEKKYCFFFFNFPKKIENLSNSSSVKNYLCNLSCQGCTANWTLPGRLSFLLILGSDRISHRVLSRSHVYRPTWLELWWDCLRAEAAEQRCAAGEMHCLQERLIRQVDSAACRFCWMRCQVQTAAVPYPCPLKAFFTPPAWSAVPLLLSAHILSSCSRTVNSIAKFREQAWTS